jgi:hypothetical protein
MHFNFITDHEYSRAKNLYLLVRVGFIPYVIQWKYQKSQGMCLTGRLTCTSAKKSWSVFPHEIKPAQALKAVLWSLTVLLGNTETQDAELRQKVFLSYAVVV